MVERASMNEKKFSFLFQGLGFVLAMILIRSAPRFIRISETGVTKMCRNIFAIDRSSEIQNVKIDLPSKRLVLLDTTLQLTKVQQLIEQALKTNAVLLGAGHFDFSFLSG